jgi:hypothetical protein
MPSIEVVRTVEADPSGIALLLAGPTAAELWPAGEVFFAPPRRTGLGFIVAVTANDDGSTLHGRVRISAAGNEPRTTELRLVATAAGDVPSRLTAAGSAFLDALVDAAQARSSAA